MTYQKEINDDNLWAATFAVGKSLGFSEEKINSYLDELFTSLLKDKDENNVLSP